MHIYSIDVNDTLPPARHAPASESLPLTIIKEMEEMFLRLGFSQTVATKLTDDQGIDSRATLANLFDENIATYCSMIRRPGSLMSRKKPESGGQIFILTSKTLNCTAFIFKAMECCSNADDIGCVNSTSVLQCQHQWELEQKKTKDTDAPKVDKNHWAKNMENILFIPQAC